MDNFEEIDDEIVQIALFEALVLLEESEQLVLKNPSQSGSVAKLFQRIHTAKSVLSVIPGSKSLSLLLQNLETILAKLRFQKQEINENQVDLFLNSIETSLALLNCLKNKQPDPNLEKEIYRCVSALRLKFSSK